METEGIVHLCAAGAKSAVHAVCDHFQQEKNEAILFIDAIVNSHSEVTGS